MSNYARAQSVVPPAHTAAAARALRRITFTFLAIEFLDELVDGSFQAAWPLLRLDLSLSYTEIGLLLAVPRLAGNVVESPLGLLGDTRHRRAIILWGGIGFVLSLLLVSLSYSFAFLLLALVLFNPASGAFVSLSQAALMDSAPARREQNMARWAFAGSLGVVAGSFTINATIAAGASWRVWFGVMSAFSVLLVLAARRFIFDAPAAAAAVVAPRHDHVSFRQGARDALRALRRGEVRRWLVLLELSDLMLDGFQGFLALYFVDVVGLNDASAGLAIAVWTAVGLGGEFLIIALLERMRGLKYLRWSAGVMLCLFPAFLLAPNVPFKLVLLGLMGLTSAGWYPLLKAQLYASMPERSGAALALNNLAGLVGVFIPFALGLFAERFGLGRMMWLLLAAPVVLLCAIPRREKSFET